ncbi:HNH endonuclease [Myroides marinus]|uniref:HNH endonuclease n=1 Tax=Myroides marinus TaxID=703342 RepID=UPI002581D4F9|nr:HNH endonuclease [Myroides marinus]MDM1359331.1 HNH endonuclease [Myroides marinus]MDM1362423.1 HNH endonuclease [Myroides marinus]MDM1370109.1 HNH endonuclease [Myroides marinus]MDM1373703.1 HNH endonuclease [Myroides marinus]
MIYLPHENNIVQIKIQGDRTSDFKEAFKKSGIDPDLATGYTWHHVADLDLTSRTTTLQLVK